MDNAAARLGGGLLFLLVAQGATAQGLPPDHGLFVEPVVGTNPLTLGWSKSGVFLPATAFAPSVRAGLLFPKLAIDARLGFFTSGNPFASYTGLDGLNLDLEAARSFWTHDNLRAYGLAGLGFGLLLDVNPTRSSVIPSGALTFGAGLQYFLCPGLGIGAEVGVRNQLTGLSPGYTVPSTSLYVALTGTWVQQGLCGQPPPQKGQALNAPGAPSDQATPPPPQDPTDINNPPSLYGHSLTPCGAYVTDGWFEPTQGVWQDDPSFDDKPRKQLTRLDGEGVSYDAELNMVKGKDTLLFGIHHYRKDGQQILVDSRDLIVLKGMSNCKVSVPVKLKFTYADGPISHALYTSEVLAQIPLEGGAASKFTPWEVKLPVREGLPTTQPFKLENDLPYKITAALIRESGAATGLEMTVQGDTEPAMGPKVHFVPVLLSAPKEGGEEDLTRATRLLAEDTAARTPDLFPIPPDGLPTFVKVLRNFIDQDIGSKWIEFRRYDAVVAGLNDSLASSAFLDGAGRVVAVMSRADFESVFGTGAAGMSVDSSVHPVPKGPDAGRWKSGLSLSWKVMLVPSHETWDTVAHELVHTLPDGWAESEMQKECGRAYHNQDVLIAHGEKIDEAGQPGKRLRMAGMVPLMGPDVLVSKMWITQCTYAHLVHELAGGPPDPPVLLIRAFVAQIGPKAKGELKPVYDLLGHADLKPGKGGPWAIVLRDEKGAELGRYPLSPRWRGAEGGPPHSLVSMVYRVPAPSGLAQLELVGPGGVLDRLRRSAQAPTVELLSPARGEPLTPKDGKIHIAWKGTGEEGHPLRYSVLYSADGGANYLTQSFEQKEAAADLVLNPQGKDHRAKVVVTDGTRSAEVTVPLLLKKP